MDITIEQIREIRDSLDCILSLGAYIDDQNYNGQKRNAEKMQIQKEKAFKYITKIGEQ